MTGPKVIALRLTIDTLGGQWNRHIRLSRSALRTSAVASNLVGDLMDGWWATAAADWREKKQDGVHQSFAGLLAEV